jgi:hypothetical protein
VARAGTALAAAQLEADTAAERLSSVEEKIAVISDEIQSLMSAASPEEGEDAAMAFSPGTAPQPSTQELVAALQAQVRGNLEAGADDAVKAVLGPLLDMLQQAQAAIASLSALAVATPTGAVGAGFAAPAAAGAGASATGAAGIEPTAGSTAVPEATDGTRVAQLRETFERPVSFGKDRLMEAMRVSERNRGPY